MTQAPTVVCVLGMHRSGTSLLTRMLHTCGLFLGPDEDIIPALPDDNPEGFWENRRFINLNEEILHELGGNFKRLPRLERGWSKDPALEPLRDKAQALVESFAGREFWGWKDPRTMATLEFWQDLLPGMKYLLAVRNPLEVALSLMSRRYDYTTWSDALDLWEQYHRIAEQTLDLKSLPVVRYERILSEPAKELGRALKELPAGVPDERLHAAAALIKPGLKRNVAFDGLLDVLAVPEPVRKRYVELWQCSGEGYPATSPSMELARNVAAFYEELMKKTTDEVLLTRLDEMEIVRRHNYALISSQANEIERLKVELESCRTAPCSAPEAPKKGLWGRLKGG